MPKCTVCSHPERYTIDRALLAGNATYESLSQRYGPSKSALYRHRRHLQENISQTRQSLKNNLSLGFLFKLNKFLDRIENASLKAEAEDNVDQVLKAARVGNRIIRDLSKMDVPWDSDTVYRLLASPQWTSQDVLLPTDPAFLAAGHQTLAEEFFHPCPEPPPDPDAEDDLDGVEPENPALSALSPEILDALHPDLLGSLLAYLTPPPNPGTPVNVGRESAAPPAIARENAGAPDVDSRSSHPALSSLPPELLADLHPDLLGSLLAYLPQTPDPGTPARRQREISAKLARKTASHRKNNKGNQQNKSAKKNTAQKPRSSFSDAPPQATVDDDSDSWLTDPHTLEYLRYLWRQLGQVPDPAASSGPSAEHPLAEIAAVLSELEYRSETENQSLQTQTPELDPPRSPVSGLRSVPVPGLSFLAL